MELMQEAYQRCAARARRTSRLRLVVAKEVRLTNTGSETRSLRRRANVQIPVGQVPCQARGQHRERWALGAGQLANARGYAAQARAGMRRFGKAGVGIEPAIRQE
jgi:hypothetical protein